MSRLPSCALVVYAWAAGCSHVAPPAPVAPVVTAAPASSAVAPAELTSDAYKTLYALGILTGRTIDHYALTAAELTIVQRGIHDAALRDTSRVDIATYGPKVTQLGRERQAAEAAREKERGLAYVARLAGEPDTQRFTSGVLVRTLTAGAGDAPKDSDSVKVNYRGTLIDGSEFDSSYARSEPPTFPLRGVIPCWTEALQHMRVGGRARLVCPSNVAYGDYGRTGKIPGGATLTFDVELLDIIKKPAPATLSPQPTAKPAF